jgi:hypothetical protein
MQRAMILNSAKAKAAAEKIRRRPAGVEHLPSDFSKS